LAWFRVARFVSDSWGGHSCSMVHLLHRLYDVDIRGVIFNYRTYKTFLTFAATIIIVMDYINTKSYVISGWPLIAINMDKSRIIEKMRDIFSDLNTIPPCHRRAKNRRIHYTSVGSLFITLLVCCGRAIKRKKGHDESN